MLDHYAYCMPDCLKVRSTADAVRRKPNAPDISGAFSLTQSWGSTGRIFRGPAWEVRMPPRSLLFASYIAPSAERSSES